MIDLFLNTTRYVGMVLVLIFAEALGLFGLIISLLMGNKENAGCAYTIIQPTV